MGFERCIVFISNLTELKYGVLKASLLSKTSSNTWKRSIVV